MSSKHVICEQTRVTLHADPCMRTMVIELHVVILFGESCELRSEMVMLCPVFPQLRLRPQYCPHRLRSEGATFVVVCIFMASVRCDARCRKEEVAFCLVPESRPYFGHRLCRWFDSKTDNVVVPPRSSPRRSRSKHLFNLPWKLSSCLKR